MNSYYAEIIADTGQAVLPRGTIVPIALFGHLAFVSPAPTLTVRTSAGQLEIPSRCARILTAAQAKRLRTERKRAQRALAGDGVGL